MRDEVSRPPLAIWRHCEYCGIWKSGPFKDLVDVPEDEVKAAIRAEGSEPYAGSSYRPAIFRPGGMHYAGGEKPMIVSHGPCSACGERRSREMDERMGKMAQRLTPPAAERDMYEERPEPTEEEARKFLSGQEDDADEGEDKGEGGGGA
jgi:hypothetical protein